MKHLTGRLAAPLILGYYFHMDGFAELGSLNSEIWYAPSVAKLPTGGLHAALQCNCVTFNSFFVACERLRLESLACSPFLLHVSHSTKVMAVQAVRFGSARGETGVPPSLIVPATTAAPGRLLLPCMPRGAGRLRSSHFMVCFRRPIAERLFSSAKISMAVMTK